MSKAVSRGQALQIAARVGTQVNWDELDGDRLQNELISLSPEEFGRRFTIFLKNGGQVEPIASFKRDMREAGWRLLEDTLRCITSAKDLELVPFLKDGERRIHGEELVVRARELKANYGQHDAEWLLEHQVEIPKEFHKFYLVFTGTVWEGSDGDRRVACLCFDDDRWELGFRGLGSRFYSDDRLPRRPK